jgi:hypothetical protein
MNIEPTAACMQARWSESMKSKAEIFCNTGGRFQECEILNTCSAESRGSESFCERYPSALALQKERIKIISNIKNRIPGDYFLNGLVNEGNAFLVFSYFLKSRQGG